jgi:hypothetical protein
LRWKLLIAASLLSAAAGVAAYYAAGYVLRSAWGPGLLPDWAVALTFVPPLGAVTFAAIFVYRHTPRRRALQALLTALLALLLALAAFAFPLAALGRS